jgi:PAT family acetyl-CoA transporter-like MFS transporter 1
MNRNKYFRSTPLEYGLVSLGGYLRFWALIFLVVTAWLAFVKKEDAVSENDPDMDVKKVYKVMWSIIRLKSMSSQPTFDLY